MSVISKEKLLIFLFRPEQHFPVFLAPCFPPFALGKTGTSAEDWDCTILYTRIYVSSPILVFDHTQFLGNSFQKD